MAFLLSGRLTPEERHPEGEVARLAAVAFGTSLQLDAPWAISALIQISLFRCDGRAANFGIDSGCVKGNDTLRPRTASEEPVPLNFHLFNESPGGR
jgi:hypothetical protein